MSDDSTTPDDVVRCRTTSYGMWTPPLNQCVQLHRHRTTSYDVVRSVKCAECAVWTPLWATAWLDFVCGCIEPHHTSVRRFLQETSRKNLSNKAKCEKQETLRQWRGRSEAKATQRRKAGVEWNNQWRWIDCASPETMHWHYDRQPVKSQPLFIERPF